MLKKAMIQFISALTLILGTVFPSTSALATTSVEPVAINSARLVTSDDQVIGDRVKSGTDANLQLQVTLSPPSGDTDRGRVQIWLPEEQLKIVTDKLPLEVDATTGGGTVEIRRNRQQKLSLNWFNVENTATF